MLKGQVLKPEKVLKASGAVMDFVVDGEKLYAATDKGTIDIFGLAKGKLVDRIAVSRIVDFMGEEIPARVYSVDRDSGALLVVAQGGHGFRNVFYGQSGKLRKIIDAATDKLMIKKARFVDKDKFVFGTLSNEISLYDLQSDKIVYTRSVSPYSFSDLCLNRDKTEVFTADESGIVHRIVISTGEVKEEYDENNVDNVYQIGYGNGIIITGGQDRRVGVYITRTQKHYYLESDFLVYSVGINADGTIGAYSANEENDVSLFNISTKKVFLTLKGHESTVTKIFFSDRPVVITSCDDPNIFIWNFDQKKIK